MRCMTRMTYYHAQTSLVLRLAPASLRWPLFAFWGYYCLHYDCMDQGLLCAIGVLQVRNVRGAMIAA